MADEDLQSSTAATSGAIDVMYFPPARQIGLSSAEDVSCKEAIEPVVALKKESRLDFVFITPCKRWSCDRRIYCDDICLDDVLRYTSPFPEHFIGIGGYNPLDIGGSIQNAEVGVRSHGFRGIYVHPGSFGVTVNDRRMYPLYVKALEWRVPVILDVRPSSSSNLAARAAEVKQVACDFDQLNLVVAQPQWTSEEMVRLAESIPHVYFCFDTAAILTPDVQALVNNPASQTRCMWGSNGIPWKESLAQLAAIQRPGLSALLRNNAVRLFGLEDLAARNPAPFVASEEAATRIAAE